MDLSRGLGDVYKRQPLTSSLRIGGEVDFHPNTKC
jgi:hypothetical protein